MPFRRKQSGANVYPTVRRRSGSGWVYPTVRRREGGAWVTVWPEPFSATGTSVYRQSFNTSDTLSGSSTITTNGGVPGYTYSTVRISGAVMTLTSGATANPTVQATGNGTNRTLEATFRTTVTDQRGVQTTTDWTATLNWGNPV